MLPNGPVVEVPDDPAGEVAALQAEPAYRALLARVEANRERRARGERPEGAVPLAALATAKQRKPTGRRPTKAGGKVSLRLPTELHEELVAQVERQHVSLNTLLVAYIAREAGFEASQLE